MRRRTAALVAALFAAGAIQAVSSADAGCLSGDVTLDVLTVPAGETACLDPAVDTTLTLTGNLIVYGRLEAKPASADVEHLIRFVNVVETQYVGGGDDPIASDVGLWVTGDGVLDLAGTPRAAWNRTGTDPSWRAGDELVVTPTASGDYTFRSFTAGSVVPCIVHSMSQRTCAEVLNLTRNVRVEGTETGRAHVHIKSTQPQSIRHAAIRWMGPRKDLTGDAYTEPVPGRSSVHFHRTGDASRGSLVEGVVVRDGGGERGYDIHASHGVTLRQVIAYRTNGDGIGWTPQEASNDTLIEDSLAASQIPVPNFRGYLLAGISLPPGVGNVIRRSVAVGDMGNSTAGGILWDAVTPTMSGVWTAEDVVSHNNKRNGVFTWQNSNGDHVVDRFVCYNNGGAGVEHGAYLNQYVYRDLIAWGNGTAGFVAHANSNLGPAGQVLTLTGGRVDGMKITKHSLEGAAPMLVSDVDLTRPGGFKLVVDEKANGGTTPGEFDLVRTGVEPSDVNVVSIVPGTVIRVTRPDGTGYQVSG